MISIPHPSADSSLPVAAAMKLGFPMSMILILVKPIVTKENPIISLKSGDQIKSSTLPGVLL